MLSYRNEQFSDEGLLPFGKSLSNLLALNSL